MCLSINTLYKTSVYDEQIHNDMMNHIHEFESILQNMKNENVSASQTSVKAFLKKNKLNKYYQNTFYFVSQLSGKGLGQSPRESTPFYTYWEVIWDYGNRKDEILSLYDTLWSKLDHDRHYCINPQKLANELWEFSRFGINAVTDERCKEIMKLI